MTVRFIDLFSGIGGFRLALESQGAQCVFTSEINKYAKQVYEANFEGMVHGDITKIEEFSIPAHDILCAGFPCQSFSTCGNGKGLSDPRGTLFYDILRIIKYHKPKVVFLENVKGLTYHNGGDTFETIKRSLSDLGYQIHWTVLNASMFEVPQKRERVYIIAVRNDIKHTFEFPKGKLTSKRLVDIKEFNVDASHFLSEARNEKIKENRILKRGGFGYHLVQDDELVFTLLREKYEFNLIVDKSKPVKLDKRKDTINSEKVRRLTPVEYGRLQGFPDNFIMPISNKQKYYMFGNSVAVPVIRAIFQEIKKIL